MKIKRYYANTRFAAETLRAAVQQVETFAKGGGNSTLNLSVYTTNTEWTYDEVEEFYADYRKHPERAWLVRELDYGKVSVRVAVFSSHTDVEVGGPDRAKVESVFAIFEAARPSALLPAPSEPKATVFIGHGHSPLWRELKDHLHEQHGYDVEAYETGARAGHAIRDILAEMVENSSFAVLVLTAEDAHADGTLHARENVIHEVGLFQGRLKYGRAIVLLEEGAQEFSNIAGIHQIRFSKGNIKETFGDVLATLRREFETPQ